MRWSSVGKLVAIILAILVVVYVAVQNPLEALPFKTPSNQQTRSSITITSTTPTTTTTTKIDGADANTPASAIGDHRLWPPQVIVQYGVPRTATTTQHILLCAIAMMLTNGRTQCVFDKPKPGRPDLLTVLKTHNPNIRGVLAKSFDAPVHNYWLFQTTEVVQPAAGRREKVAVVQDPKVLFAEGFPYLESQINNQYRLIFNLTSTQVRDLVNYMRPWAELRRCCGVQASRTYQDSLRSGKEGHHHCFEVDVPLLEKRLARSALGQKFSRLLYVSALEYATGQPALGRGYCRQWKAATFTEG